MRGQITPALMLVASCLVAAQEPGGAASGTLTVNGTTTALTHAYALKKPGGDTLIVVSDTALTTAQLSDSSTLAAHLRAGKAHAIAAFLPYGKPSITRLYDPAFEIDEVPLAGGNYKVDVGSPDGQTLTGRIYTQKPDSFKRARYEYSVAFKAPLIEPAALSPSAPVSPNDPIVLAVTAYLEAAHAGDIAAMRAAMVPEAAATLAGEQSKMMVSVVRALTPSGKVTSIETSGDSALVTLTERDGDSVLTAKLALRKVGGAWKVDPRK